MNDDDVRFGWVSVSDSDMQKADEHDPIRSRGPSHAMHCIICNWVLARTGEGANGRRNVICMMYRGILFRDSHQRSQLGHMSKDVSVVCAKCACVFSALCANFRIGQVRSY